MKLLVSSLVLIAVGFSWEAEIKTGLLGLTGFVETTTKHLKRGLCDEGDACDNFPVDLNAPVWSPNYEKAIPDEPSFETLENQDVPNDLFPDPPTLPPNFGLSDEPPTLPPNLDTNPPDISNCKFEGSWLDLYEKMKEGTLRCD